MKVCITGNIIVVLKKSNNFLYKITGYIGFFCEPEHIPMFFVGVNIQTTDTLNYFPYTPYSYASSYIPITFSDGKSANMRS